MFDLRRPMALGLAVLALAGLLAACASPPTPAGTSGAPSSSGATIVLQNLAFNPASLSVQSGAGVVFANKDSAPHHIVVGTTDLGVVQPGGSVSWTAGSDAVYMLRCLIHPQMSGQITVGAGGATIGTTPPAGATSTAPAGGSSAPGGGYGY